VATVRLDAELFPFLGQLSSASQNDLKRLTATNAAGGRQLLRRGDAVGGAFLVLSGSLRAYYVSAEGREATLYHVQAGETCILALNAALNDEPYPAWVDAPKGSAFVRVPAPLFQRMLDTERAFRSFVFGAMSNRIFELMCALEERGSALVEQRVARFLQRRHRLEPDAAINATQASIARELGTAREVVFRALRALGQRGLIRTGRGRIQVLDAAGLDRASGLER
jgi:CRP/FNR family transcriptional regulator, anaerobic regulatory protein